MWLECLSLGVTPSGDEIQSGIEMSELVDSLLSVSIGLVILLSLSRCRRMTLPSRNSIMKVTAPV